jgi:transcriptional regulator with XRE-family HTH domain
MSPTPYGERLSEAIRLAGLPEREARAKLAKALGISVQAVGGVLIGTTKAFAVEQSARAARFLEVDHFWLATGEGEPRPAGLSDDAAALARQYDRLSDEEKRRYRVLLIAAKNGLSDAEVAEFLPAVPQKEEQ